MDFDAHPVKGFRRIPVHPPCPARPIMPIALYAAKAGSRNRYAAAEPGG
jgi:hypothetical protein